MEVQLNLGVTLHGDNLLQERRAKASSLWRLDPGSAAFLPEKMDDPSSTRGLNRPAYVQVTLGERQGTEFRGVGGELMERHADWYREVRDQSYVWSFKRNTWLVVPLIVSEFPFQQLM